MVYVMEVNVISLLVCGYVCMVWWVYVECGSSKCDICGCLGCGGSVLSECGTYSVSGCVVCLIGVV